MKTVSPFTQPQVVPNLYGFLYTAEHTKNNAGCWYKRQWLPATVWSNWSSTLFKSSPFVLRTNDERIYLFWVNYPLRFLLNCFNWASVVMVICVMKISESISWIQVWSQQILLVRSCDWCIQLTMIKFGYYSLTFCWGVWEEIFKRKQSQNPFEGFIRDCIQIQRIQSLISTRVVLWRKAL